MTVFAIVCSAPTPALASKIEQDHPGKFIAYSDRCWLVSFEGTSQELSDKLGITDGSTGTALVIAASGYFGRAPTNIWEWFTAHWGNK